MFLVKGLVLATQLQLVVAMWEYLYGVAKCFCFSREIRKLFFMESLNFISTLKF